MSLEFAFAFEPPGKNHPWCFTIFISLKKCSGFFSVYIPVEGNCEKKLLLQYGLNSDTCLSTCSKNPLKSSACTVLSHWLTKLFPSKVHCWNLKINSRGRYIHPSVCLSLCPSVSQSVHPFVFLFVHSFIHPFILSLLIFEKSSIHALLELKNPEWAAAFNIWAEIKWTNLLVSFIRGV